MKTHVLALVFGLLLTATSGAQTFVIDWAKPDTVTGTPTGGQIKRDGTVRNLNATTKELYFRYNIENLALDHTAQLCMNLCWSLYTGVDYPYEREGQILEATTGTLPIYVDVAPNGNSGKSDVYVTLFSKADTTDKISFKTTFVADPTASVLDASELGLVVSPLPATESVNVQGDALTTVVSLGLYDATGNIVRSFGTSGSRAASLPLNGIASGTYRLLLTQSNGTISAAPVVITR